MRHLLLLIPEEAFPLLAVLALVAVIAGLARPRLLLGIVAFMVLLPVIGELFGVFLDAMPWWLVALILGGFVMMVVRAALGLLLGTRAADHMVGALAADAFKFAFRAAFRAFLFSVHLAGRLLSR